jgi:hypothetical protein
LGKERCLVFGVEPAKRLEKEKEAAGFQQRRWTGRETEQILLPGTGDPVPVPEWARAGNRLPVEDEFTGGEIRGTASLNADRQLRRRRPRDRKWSGWVTPGERPQFSHGTYILTED